jgi:hypothetical protein
VFENNVLCRRRRNHPWYLLGIMRPLKHHEKKLLKKVDFLQWKREHNIREVKVLARFLIADREDYSKYEA